MNGRRRGLNPWLGMLDLVFLLCMLFFVTTVVSVRRLALVEEVADDEARGPGSAIVVRLESDGERFALVSPGERPGPGAKPLLAWLEATCSADRTPVEVACPPEATHVACKRGVLALRRRARSCAYRY